MSFMTFLLNPRFNFNGWAVTEESIKKCAKTAIGRHGIVHHRCEAGAGCELDHPPLHDHQGVSCLQEEKLQRPYWRSTIVDVEYDGATQTLWGIHRTRDKALMDDIRTGRLQHVSPSICPKPGSEQRVKAGVIEYVLCDDWDFLHVAFVDDPAYGELATVRLPSDSRTLPRVVRGIARQARRRAAIPLTNFAVPHALQASVTNFRMPPPALQAERQFDESKVNRDDAGKFSSGGGGGGSGDDGGGDGRGPEAPSAPSDESRDDYDGAPENDIGEYDERRHKDLKSDYDDSRFAWRDNRDNILRSIEDGDFGVLETQVDDFLSASDDLLQSDMDLIGYQVRANASPKNDYSDFDAEVSFDDFMAKKAEYIEARQELEDTAVDLQDAYTDGRSEQQEVLVEELREKQGRLTNLIEDTVEAYRIYQVAEAGEEIESTRSASIAAGDVGALQEVRLTPPKKKRL